MYFTVLRLQNISKHRLGIEDLALFYGSELFCRTGLLIWQKIKNLNCVFEILVWIMLCFDHVKLAVKFWGKSGTLASVA